MELAELITTLRVRSGRYDLSDEQLTAYLNSGQRWLDIKVPNRQSESGRLMRQVQARSVGFTFTPYCRVLERVYLHTDAGRIALQHVSMDYMRSAYPEAAHQTIPGTPLYWAAANLRTADDVITLDRLQASIGFLDLIVGVDYEYNGVLLAPIPDATYSYEVVGRFYSQPLSSDNPKSWWSVRHYELLLSAARRALEADHRNIEGVRGWELVMDAELSAIDLDAAEEAVIEEELCMEG